MQTRSPGSKVAVGRGLLLALWLAISLAACRPAPAAAPSASAPSPPSPTQAPPSRTPEDLPGASPTPLASPRPSLTPTPRKAASTPSPATATDDDAMTVIEAREYDVYAALLSQFYFPEGALRVVILGETQVGPSQRFGLEDRQDYIQEQMGAALGADTLRDAVARNAQSARLEARLAWNGELILLDPVQFEAYFSAGQGGWDQFYMDYPESGGVISFSRVGFNASGDQALVYAGRTSGYLAGAGHYLLLELEEGAWKVAQFVLAWVS